MGISSEQDKWDVEAIISSGVVSVRDLSHHTSEILRAIIDCEQPLVISRHGAVIAALTPINMRQMVDVFMGLADNGLSAAMVDADDAFKNGKTLPASKAFAESD